MSIDKFHENNAQLYQVFQNRNTGSDVETIEYTPGPLASTLASEFPEVELAVSTVPSYWFSGKGLIAVGDTRFKAAPQYASRDFFDVFTFPLIEGNKKEALTSKQGILLSESLCRRLFHTTSDVIGKSVQWDHLEIASGEFFVTGVFKDVPPNSTTTFDVLFSFDLFLEKRPNLQYWYNSDPCTFVLLRRGTDPGVFNAKIEGLRRTKTNNPNESTFAAQRYSEKYLYGHYQLEHGGYGGGRIQYVRLFSVIALFIVAIACINFMNLSTARASRRQKEIGIKKVVGAGRWSIINQYLGEAMLMTFLSLLVALAGTYLLLPAFNTFTGKHLSLDIDPKLLISLISIAGITGFVAGSYPALYLSGFNPVAILKGKITSSRGEVRMRQSLVIFQFTLSVILIASVLVVYRQIQFIQTQNLGYNRDNIVTFEMESKGQGSITSFLDELGKIPGVTHVGSYYHNLLGNHGGIDGIEWDGKDPNLRISYANLEIGFGFIETLGIEMIEGRTFSRDMLPERQIIFNEEAIRKMGIKDPVGKNIRLWGQEKQIVGVARDFNFESLYSDIQPCFMQVFPELPNAIVKIRAGTEKASLNQLEKIYQRFNPGLPFEFSFLDADYQALYIAEQRVGILSRYFAALAILISSLGLLGLALFTAERRTKEISIRKVLGASVAGISGLLSKEFLKPVLVAVAIAVPMAYYLCDRWLQSFAYRVDVDWWMLIGAGAIAIGIAFITISVHVLKAAWMNPAKNLRSE